MKHSQCHYQLSTELPKVTPEILRWVVFRHFFKLVIDFKNSSVALSKELEDNNVKVHLVTPMFVRTNMISFSTVAPRGNCFIPTPEQYARATINKIDKCSQTCGYWLHGVQVRLRIQSRTIEIEIQFLQHALFNSIPEFMRILIAFNVNKKFREQYHEQRRVKHFEI